MAPLGKERALNSTLSVATTSVTMATIVGNTSKVPVLEIFKLDPFAGSRFKFKAFYTQVRLGI
jgi:hypothetical protein